MSNLAHLAEADFRWLQNDASGADKDTGIWVNAYNDRGFAIRFYEQADDEGNFEIEVALDEATSFNLEYWEWTDWDQLRSEKVKTVGAALAKALDWAQMIGEEDLVCSANVALSRTIRITLTKDMRVALEQLDVEFVDREGPVTKPGVLELTMQDALLVLEAIEEDEQGSRPTRVDKLEAALFEELGNVIE